MVRSEEVCSQGDVGRRQGLEVVPQDRHGRGGDLGGAPASAPRRRRPPAFSLAGWAGRVGQPRIDAAKSSIRAAACSIFGEN